MSTTAEPRTTLDTLREVEQRVLWLATATVDHANRVRPNPGGLKVGGHQASSASIVSIMTTLYLRHLSPEDRVSVKPHASPVLHALEVVLGQLEGTQLETLRAFGGLQSYPSRTKDPVPADYSTGSVGIGATRARAAPPGNGPDATRFIKEAGLGKSCILGCGRKQPDGTVMGHVKPVYPAVTADPAAAPDQGLFSNMVVKPAEDVRCLRRITGPDSAQCTQDETGDDGGQHAQRR